MHLKSCFNNYSNIGTFKCNFSCKGKLWNITSSIIFTTIQKWLNNLLCKHLTIWWLFHHLISHESHHRYKITQEIYLSMSDGNMELLQPCGKLVLFFLHGAITGIPTINNTVFPRNLLHKRNTNNIHFLFTIYFMITQDQY